MKKWIKENKMLIMCIAILFIIVAINILPIANVYAEINPNNVENQGQNWFKQIGQRILSAAGGVFMMPLALLMGVFNVIVFMVLSFLFTAIGANGGLAFPFPDQIIFNQIAFFDPNFINPSDITSSPVNIMQTVIQNLYYSFFTIAITLFVIAAIVIGIKLAISTIASEKAQYKKALVTWIVGILLLFTVHFLMAGIFALNEKIVEIASTMTATIKFKVGSLDMIGSKGSLIKNVLKSIDSFFNTNIGEAAEQATTLEMTGYGGFIMLFLLKSVSGDMTGSIICALILGQSVALVIMYTKRLFYCIILGVLAPLIVAADVIKKAASS